uniref:RdRp n=1 Tax=Hubei partiti-like virus 52 TaxID=1923061 RepID=A0A1L3KLI4_9VIRU|nr:RdRp [Hubei partiti-like virus 52]
MTISSMILDGDKATLWCGCQRQHSIFVTPTKCRSNSREVTHNIRSFLSAHSETPPSDFDKYDADLSDLLLDTHYPTHFNDLIDRFVEKSSCGLFFKEQYGYRTQGDVLQDPVAVHTARTYIHRIKSGLPVKTTPWHVVCVSAKFDFDTKETKHRVIWVPDMCRLWAEKMFAQDIYDTIDFDRVVPTPENRCYSLCGEDTIDTDFSGFDASVPAWLINAAFDRIKETFDFSTYICGSPVSKRYSLERLFEWVRYGFIHSQYQSLSLRGTKHHGVPSGSAFTWLINTICSRMLLDYVTKHLGLKESVVDTYGDDGHITHAKPHSEAICEVLTSLSFSVKIDFASPCGHNTYCKTECHNGIPFHEGLWARNILACCREGYEGAVAWCLLKSNSWTILQESQLRSLATRPDKFPTWLLYMFGKGRPLGTFEIPP